MPMEINAGVVNNISAIPGLRFRPVVAADAPALFAVHERCAAYDQIDRLSSIEHAPTQDDLAQRLADVVRQEQTRNWLVAQVEDEVIGYSRILWWTEDDGMWVYLTVGWVVPDWRGKGIGTAMLHWAESRIRELAKEHPNEGKWEYASNASSTEKEATALLQAEGYHAAYTVMDMALTDFSL